MSSKFLFLYNTPMQRAELIKCEKVIKALFRKFRKSAVFTYLQTDTSLYCIDAFLCVLFDEFQKSDAVFINRDISKQLQDILGEYAEVLSRENINKAVEIAIDLSLKRKKKLTVCNYEDTGTFIEEALTNAFNKSMHIQKEYLFFDEALFTCMNTIPQFDVVLTTEQAAKILQMHIGYTGGLCSAPTPDGYSVIYTDRGKVYTRQTLPYEQMNNTVLFSSLLTFSAILEKEFAMKNAADWLKRASSLSFETHKNALADDFINRVISEIDKPMRKHAR